MGSKVVKWVFSDHKKTIINSNHRYEEAGRVGYWYWYILFLHKARQITSNSDTSKARAKNFRVPEEGEGEFHTAKPEKPHTTPHTQTTLNSETHPTKPLQTKKQRNNIHRIRVAIVQSNSKKISNHPFPPPSYVHYQSYARSIPHLGHLFLLAKTLLDIIYLGLWTT